MKVKDQEKPVEPVKPEEKPPATTEVVTQDADKLKVLFARGVNAISPVKSITLKSVLTKPLVAAAHFKQFLFTAHGDMYVMILPAKGRGAEPTEARVIDGLDVESGQECILMVNAMMAGAMKRAGYAVITDNPDPEAETRYVPSAGNPLKGHSFAFKSGNINEDAGYRHVDVVEVEIER